MCGIAGIVELEAGAVPDPEALRRMAAAIAHRGPDQEGFHVDGPVGLAHRRLSIIDLSSGNQPMLSPSGESAIVFNGEIYNYLELRRELESRGRAFRTRSDTEVLLQSLLEQGVGALPRLSGMFAFAHWDRPAGRLILARDHFGKKPLFYHLGPKRLLFASEIKAILAHGGLERRVSLPALRQYLRHSYVVGEETIFDGIRRLPPASSLVLERGRASVRQYWEFRMEPDPAPRSAVEVRARVGELLEAAVKRRLMSEVPLGAFLSGGLDSSCVVALMARLSSRPVKTFTIGFEEAGYSEVEDARAVAKHLGTDHSEMTVRPSAMGILPDLVWHCDEPFGDSSMVPTYYVCREARKLVTVALSGDGGDEVFAGYERYRTLDRSLRFRRIPWAVRRGLLRPLSGLLPITFPGWNLLHAAGHLDRECHPFLLGIYPYILDHLLAPELAASFARLEGETPREELEDELVRRNPRLDPVSLHQLVDTRRYLPDDILVKVDRMSMASSLEVRSPLLDRELAEHLSRLPVEWKLQGGISKRILREWAAPLLPPSVMTKKKQGFAIPKDRWFREELRGASREILLDRSSLSRGYFRERTIRTMLDHHLGGRRDYSVWIWCLLVLEMWHRVFLDAGSRRV